MRNPIASTSLREFWAHRWNLPTSSVLRSTCYDPILRVFAPQSSSQPPRAGHSTPTHSTQHNNGASKTTTSSSALQTLPDSSCVQQRRYNLHSRPDSISVRSTVPTDRGTQKNGKSVLPAPVDMLASHPVVPSDSDSADSGMSSVSQKSNGKGYKRRAVVLAKISGSCLAFFVSGLAHHFLFHLFAGTSIHDVRFALLFWIQPPLIALQDAWTRSLWWRSVQCQQPLLARCVQAPTPIIKCCSRHFWSCFRLLDDD